MIKKSGDAFKKNNKKTLPHTVDCFCSNRVYWRNVLVLGPSSEDSVNNVSYYWKIHIFKEHLSDKVDALLFVVAYF